MTHNDFPPLPKSIHFYFAPEDNRTVRKPLSLFTSEQMQEYFRSVTSLQAMPPSELGWLYSHCRAIGMRCMSDSGKKEHDIALFTINQKTTIEKLTSTLAAHQVKQPYVTDADVKTALSRNEIQPNGDRIIMMRRSLEEFLSSKAFTQSKQMVQEESISKEIIDKPVRSTLEKFRDLHGIEEPNPLERLRFFCSLSMNREDWLDVEQFFTTIMVSGVEPMVLSKLK